MCKLKLIYVVDDDGIYHFIIKTELEASGKVDRINFFKDGKLAFEAFEQAVMTRTNIPELILLDINMPVLDGWGFLDEFQKIKSNLETPCDIFLVSSSIDDRDIERSKEYEAVMGYIVKPLKKEKLEIVFSKLNLI